MGVASGYQWSEFVSTLNRDVVEVFDISFDNHHYTTSALQPAVQGVCGDANSFDTILKAIARDIARLRKAPVEA